MPRHVLTPAERRRGYRRALRTCMKSWALLAWFHRRLRKSYRSRKPH